MAMKRSVLLSVIFLGLTVGNSYATGGLDCSANDKNLNFDMAGSVGRTIAMFYQEQRAMIEISLLGLDPKVARQNLQGKIIHSWISSDEIRFQYEIDTLEVSLTFTVMTKNTGRDSDIGSVFEGTYDLVMSSDSKTFTTQGPARCELY
jgi:hypothetical protein